MASTPRGPWAPGRLADDQPAAEQVAATCLRANLPATATAADYAAALAELRQALAERLRFPVQSPTEAPDAE